LLARLLPGFSAGEAEVENSILKRERIGSCELILGDCLEVLPTLGPVDGRLILATDPPYGCGKAEWDSAFPVEWYAMAPGDVAVIITGSAGLKGAINLVGDDYVDTIAARNLNGMTRGPIGFGNWISAVVARGKPRQGINAFDFSVSGEMPPHPSPKPLGYMIRLIERVSSDLDTILDPFMGSGTTLVACAKLGRKGIGIEVDPGYFDIACKRVEEAYRQPDFFVEPPKPAEQLDMLK